MSGRILWWRKSSTVVVITAALVVSGFFAAKSVFAAHTHTVSATPQYETGSTATSYSFGVTNNGPDAISLVRFTMPVTFSGISCGVAPAGWIVSTTTATYCEFADGVASAIASGQTKTFVVNATTAAVQGTYSWTVQTQDLNLGGTFSSVNVEVDTTAPTAAITYSDADALVKAGDSLLITATFNEPMADAPVVRLAIAGSNTLAATAMTKVSTTVYTYTHTVGAGDGAANVTLSVGEDRAGNVITAAPTSGGSFTVDNTAPTVPTRAISSNNVKSTSLAKVGNVVTLTLTTNESVGTPVVTIDAQSAAVSGGPTNWTATYTMAGGDAEGVIPFTINVTDLAGNPGVQATTTTNASAVTFDRTAPTLNPVTIASNNANSTSLAKTGDAVTVAFTSSEAIDTVSSTVAGNAGVVNSLGGNNWNTTYTFAGTETEGVVPFSILFQDAAGNTATRTTTTNASSVTYDKTVPTAAITYSDTDARVKAGDSLTITATFTEAMHAPTTVNITLSAPNAVGPVAMTRVDATHYTYVHTVGAGNGTVTVSLSTGADLAGNILNGTPTSGATFVVDNTLPTVTSIVTKDADTNGSVERATITFSEAVSDATFAAGNFTIGGSIATSIVTGTANDNVFDIVTTSQVAGTNVKEVTYTPGTGADLVGNLLAAVVAGTVTETDAAGPVMISALTTSTTTITVTFSEDLNGTTVNGSGSDFTAAGVTVSAASETSAGVVTITTSAFGTGVTPLVSLVGSVSDLPSAGGNTSPVGQTITPADGVAPVIATTAIVGTTVQGGGDTIVVTFSEPVVADDGTWSATDEFTIVESPDNTAKVQAGAGFVYGGSQLTITLSEDPTLLTTYLRNGNVVALTPGAAAVRDAAGNFLLAVEVVGTTAITGDLTQPSVALTYSPDRTLVGLETVTITATFSEAIHEQLGERPTISIATPGDGDVATTGMTKTSNTVWTYTWQTPGGLDDEGTSTITITSTDLAGNANATATNNSRLIDTQAPMIDSFTVGGITATTASLSVTTSTVANCRYAPSNVAFGSMTAMSTTGGTSHSQTLTGLSGSTNYTYYVRCQDAALLISAASLVAFTTTSSDVIAPTVSSQTPVDNTTGVAVTVNPTITFSEVMDANSVNSNTVKLKKFSDDSDVSVAYSLNDARTVVSLDPTADLANSTQYYLWVSGARDVAGNTVTPYTTKASQEFTTAALVVDTIPPVAPVITTGNATIDANSYTLAGTASADTVLLTIKNGTTSVGVVVGTSWSLVVPLTQNSANSFTAVAEDAAGNTSTSNIVVITEAIAVGDTTAPAVPVITTTTATVDANSHTITGTAGADAPTDGSRIVTIYRNGSVVASLTLTTGQTAWSFTAPLLQSTANSFTATSTDAAGNASAASAAVVITEATAVVDTTAPGVPTITTLSTTVDASSYTIAGTAADDGGTRRVDVYNGANLVASVFLSSGQTSWSVIVSLTQASANSFTAKSTDVAGNTSAASAAVVITEAEGAATLAVTQVSATRSFAVADNDFATGWQWVFSVTVPTAEASLSMKFADFVSGSNTVAAATNIRFYSAQSSNAATSATPITVAGANAYAGPLLLNADLDATTAGRQIRITVEARVPVSTAGGSYSTSYGVRSN